VRSPAQVDEVALAVQGDRLIGGNRGNNLRLVFLADTAKKTDSCVTFPLFAHNRLVPVDDLLHALFDYCEILFAEGLGARKVIIEPVLDRRPDGHLRVWPEFLDRLGEHVCGIVPQKLETVPGIASDNFNPGVAGNIAAEVPEFAVHAHSDGAVGETLADARGNLGAAGNRVEFPDGAVGECDVGHLLNQDAAGCGAAVEQVATCQRRPGGGKARHCTGRNAGPAQLFARAPPHTTIAPL
jgi:hypothetical protein